MGGVTFVKKWADLRFVSGGGPTSASPGGRFFIKPRARKESYFRLALGLVYFFLYLFYA